MHTSEVHFLFCVFFFAIFYSNFFFTRTVVSRGRSETVKPIMGLTTGTVSYPKYVNFLKCCVFTYFLIKVEQKPVFSYVFPSFELLFIECILQNRIMPTLTLTSHLGQHREGLQHRLRYRQIQAGIPRMHHGQEC